MQMLFIPYNQQHEVDFLLGSLAIEVKSKKKTTAQDAKSLLILKEEGKHKNFLVVSQDPLNRKQDGISYIHWEHFLKKLWSGEYLA